MPGKEVGAAKQSMQAPVSSKGRLEDLLNDLLSLDETPAAADSNQSEIKRAEILPGSPVKPALGLPPAPQVSQDFSFSHSAGQTQSPQSVNFAASGKKSVPQSLRARLKLPADTLGVYQALRSFQQNNRHQPYVELPCGLVAYVEYDVESERIRLFLGNKREFVLFPRGVREQSAVLVIDEFFEYKVETKVSQFLGFAKKEQIAHEKNKLGMELLRGNDMIPGKRVYPVLYFSLFADKSCGISSCAVKAECTGK